MRKLVVTLTAAMASAVAVAEATLTNGILPEPEVRLPKMAKAPTIDGVISPGEWDGAAEMQKFCVIRQRAAMNAEGRFWLGRDDANLYIAIASEIGPHGMLRNVKPVGHNDSKAFWDDCMEFDFIQDWHAKRPTCLHLIVNYNGAYRVTGVIDGKTTSWEGMETFTTKSSERDGLWHFEFAIPLKNALLDQNPSATKGVRIARNWKRVYDDGFGRQTSWSPQDGAFGTAANCPKVIFDDNAPVVRMTDLGTHNKGLGDLSTYAVAATVSNPTAKPLDLKIAYTGRPVNSQPCVFSEAFTLKPGDEKSFSSRGAVLGEETIVFAFRVTDKDEKTVYYQRNLDFQANWPDVRWIGSAKDVKAVGFQFAYYPSCNVINARVNLEKAKKRPNPTKFSVMVKNLKGEQVAQKEFTATGDVTDLALDLPDLRPITTRTGEPKYEIVLDIPGVKDGLVKGTFYRHVFEWEGNKIGLSDTVVPPFTPLKREEVKVKGEGERRNSECELEKVSVVLRDHIVDRKTGLWRQVTAAGKDLLARPMRFVAAAGNGTNGTDGTTGTKPDSQMSQSSQMSQLSCSSSWDYDGVEKLLITLQPGHHEPFSLEIPMKGAEARLMHASVDGLRNNYCGAVPAGTGRVWDSTKQGGRVNLIGDYLPYLWIGGTLRGIAVFGENDKGWVIASHVSGLATSDGRVAVPSATADGGGTPSLPHHEIIREADGTVVIRLNLVQHAVDLTEPRTILLGFQATPVKPMVKGWRAKSIGTLIGATYYFGGQGDCVAPFDETTEFWDEMTKARNTGKVNSAYLEDVLKNRFVYKGKPGSKERAAHMDTIRRHFYAGMNWSAGDYRTFTKTGEHAKFVFYTNARGIEYGVNAGKTFADEWTRWEYFGRLDRDFGRSEKRDYDLDPVASFRDYAAWWYRKMIESKACQALYWDDIYLSGNYSRPLCDTYPLANGEWQPATGIFAMKELVRRCAVMQAEIGAEPMDNWVHMTNTALAPILGFAGVNYDWEDTADLQTFQDRYGRDYLLASAIGRQFGNRVAVMGYISKTTPEHLAWLERTGVGVTICHELQWPRVAQWRTAMKRLVDWGYRADDTRVWNYWDEDVKYPLACTGEDCVSIAMARNGEAVVVICDWGDGGTVNARPDCAALGIPAGFQAVDMETGKVWPVEGGVLKVALKKHDYAMIRLKAK